MNLSKAPVLGIMIMLMSVSLTISCADGGFKAKVPKIDGAVDTKPQAEPDGEGGLAQAPEVGGGEGEDKTPSVAEESQTRAEQLETAGLAAEAFISAAEIAGSDRADVTPDSIARLANTFPSTSEKILALTVSKAEMREELPNLHVLYGVQVRLAVRLQGKERSLIFGGKISPLKVEEKPQLYKIAMTNEIVNRGADEVAEAVQNGTEFSEEENQTEVLVYTACQDTKCERVLLMIQIRDGNDVFEDTKAAFILESISGQEDMQILRSSISGVQSFESFVTEVPETPSSEETGSSASAETQAETPADEGDAVLVDQTESPEGDAVANDQIDESAGQDTPALEPIDSTAVESSAGSSNAMENQPGSESSEIEAGTGKKSSIKEVESSKQQSSGSEQASSSKTNNRDGVSESVKKAYLEAQQSRIDAAKLEAAKKDNSGSESATANEAAAEKTSRDETTDSPFWDKYLSP